MVIEVNSRLNNGPEQTKPLFQVTNGEIEPRTRSHQDSNDDEGEHYFYRKLLSEVW